MRRCAKTLCLIFLSVFCESAAFGGNFRPQWGGRIVVVEQDQNESYLANLDSNPLTASFEVLDAAQVLQLSVQYQDLTRNYELQRKYSLISQEMEVRHFEQMSEFSKEITRLVKRHQIDRERKKLLAFLKQFRKNKIIKTVAGSVGIFGVIAGFYFGKSFEFSLGKDLNVSGSTTLSNRSGRVLVSSPWGEVSLDVLGSAPVSRDPLSVAAGDPLARGDERFRFVISRYLAQLDFSSVVSYLGTSNILGASLIKRITPQLSFIFDTYYPLKPEESDVKEVGKAIKLSYATSF